MHEPQFRRKPDRRKASTMDVCQSCGQGRHVVDREVAFQLATRYPLTICFVARVIDQFEGDVDRAAQWLDVWAALGIYTTPEYYRTKVLQESATTPQMP